VTHRLQQFQRLREALTNCLLLDNLSAILTSKHARVGILRSDAINVHGATTSRVLIEKLLNDWSRYVHKGFLSGFDGSSLRQAGSHQA
jgi:hypothetical protein